MNMTRHDLPEGIRTQIATLLNARLADCLDLYLATKQAHWNVKGPTFIALHELFDSVASNLSDHADTMAERAVILGGQAQGTRQALSASTIEEYPLDLNSGRGHVEQLANRLAAFAKSIRAAIDIADSAGDADTADLFTEVSRGVDKDLWFVEAHLGEG